MRSCAADTRAASLLSGSSGAGPGAAKNPRSPSISRAGILLTSISTRTRRRFSGAGSRQRALRSRTRTSWARTSSPPRMRPPSKKTTNDTSGSPTRRAPMELHPGATYLHRGRAYEVEDLNLPAHQALVRRVPNRYYTRPRVETDVEILEESEKRDLWFALPPLPQRAEPGNARSSFIEFLGALHAAEHAFIGILPLFAMCDRGDIEGLSVAVHRQTRVPTVFVYDGYPGGVGISERGYDAFEEVARDTLGVLAHCPCKSGCPACVQSPKCGNWNEPLSKEGAVAVLRYLLGQVSHYPAV